MTDQTRRHTHLGAYGLVVWQEKVLLVRKSRGPYTGSWDLPGGHIEFGDIIVRHLKMRL